MYLSQKHRRCSESMDANRFEKWFENILPKLGENEEGVVLNDARYDPRRQEKVPTTA